MFSLQDLVLSNALIWLQYTAFKLGARYILLSHDSQAWSCVWRTSRVSVH